MSNGKNKKIEKRIDNVIKSQKSKPKKIKFIIIILVIIIISFITAFYKIKTKSFKNLELVLNNEKIQLEENKINNIECNTNSNLEIVKNNNIKCIYITVENINTNTQVNYSLSVLKHENHINSGKETGEFNYKICVELENGNYKNYLVLMKVN